METGKNIIIGKRRYILKSFYLLKKIYINILLQLKNKGLGKKSIFLYTHPFYKIKIWLNLKREIDKGIYLGTFEFNNTFIFHELVNKNDAIIDIGANIGLYTLIAAKKLRNTGRIYAFEPSIVAIKDLRKNIETNKYLNIDIYDFALSDSNGKEEFYRCEDDAYNSLIAKPMQEAIDTYIVDVITLDEFVKTKKIQKIDIIKIDAEGLDYRILKGAQLTLKKFKPIIFCEINKFYLDEISRVVFNNYLEELGYEVLTVNSYKYFLRIERFNPLKDNNSEIICLPKATNK